jgi:hypothetical protein
VLASRPALPTDEYLPSGRSIPAAGRLQLYGLRRIVQAYGVSLLAAVLGLPVVAAGLITSNNCQLRGFDCLDRLAYGLIGATVLAAVAQLMLALHFRLGWSFWVGSSLLMSTTLLNTSSLPAVIGVLLIAPGVAAWVSEPPSRRGVLAHWGPRYAALCVLVMAAAAIGLLT